MKDVLVKANWFEQIQNAPEEIQKELFYRIIKLGVFEEEIDTSNDDWSLADSWRNIRGNIVRMQTAHEANVEFGKTHGRQITGDPQAIYDFVQKHPKAKVTDIGIALNLPERPSAKGVYGYLYDNPGWKNRKITNWVYDERKKNSDENYDNVKNSYDENSGGVKNFTEPENLSVKTTENFYDEKNYLEKNSSENSEWNF